MTKKLFVNVILPLKVEGVFTYEVPTEWALLAHVGKRAVVQFGKRKIYTALIVSVHQQTPTYETKPIISILDDQAIVTENQLKLWEWMSRYYLCTIGETMKAALPSGLKLESESVILPGINFNNFIPDSDEEYQIKKLLEQKDSALISDLQSLLEKKNIQHLLNKLLQSNFIQIEESLAHRYIPKKVEYIDLAINIESEEHLNSIFNQLNKAPKQSDVLLSYFSLNNSQYLQTVPIKKEELLKKSKDNGSATKKLIEKGILKSVFFEESRVFNKVRELKLEKNKLEKKQEEALLSIENQFKEKNVILLHGVTSSGKTEIYIHLIEKYIQQGKQVLYLLPEIALTSQMVNRLCKALGDRVAVYHSKYSDNERTELYLHMATAHQPVSVILGVRSSIFLPFRNLGLIIIDEEHETTYKQQNPEPHFNARDTAIILALQHNAKVLLGSATPSIETYFNAQTGKYGLVELNERFHATALPEIKVIDIKDERKKHRVKQQYYSDIFLKELVDTIQNGKQAIIFQNRRGYSPYIECEECGWVPDCTHCDVKLTYHKAFNKLICHYCGYSIPIPLQCNECKQPTLKIRGLGTERIEDELAMFIPNAHIARMDLDTTRTKIKIEQLFEQIEKKEIDILVGTQMVTKGLDFENIELIGILDADAMLNYPDFRSDERTFQLFTQVAGRAGRRLSQGKVIIQTTQPQHPVIQFLTKNDYKGFVSWQLAERKRFNYPPYTRLIRLELKHRDLNITKETAKKLAIELRKIKTLEVLGPKAPIIGKIKNLYIMELWLKLPRNNDALKLRDNTYHCIHRFFSSPELQNFFWSADVDPL
ncbi:MAG: primosomal protein N' [Bacteroidales bacterium]|nr:primosomal protein N' [Bacteroidales bacterium]